MKSSSFDFDVIVVGGGHAGIEAAYASANLGSKTLLITLDPSRIGHMPCNPAIGGIGKSHIVFEISALGGLMPKLCTQTYLQARMLNTRKGPAVQGLRLQIDKQEYSKLSQKMVKESPNITIVADKVDEIILDNQKKTRGIKTSSGQEYLAPNVILTTGTFLRGLVHVGQRNYNAGRQGEDSVYTLSDFLKKLDLQIIRLKTGTPPRLLRSSLNYSSMEYQGSDDLNYLFEFTSHKVTHKEGCYITKTNQQTHEIIKNNFHLSPIFTGNINGTPPRYCPSIEDKISRFQEKTSHHVFVEPEGANSEEMYPNGLSTSLPLEIQEKFIRSIKGFENAIITRPGYAVEYDAVLPYQLNHTLELKKIPGLFLAGQINGTTGYEEAAGQGIIAGINAHLKTVGKEPFIIERYEGYIGIMIDDLVTMGVDEPYRMFTSRAERRLLLRQDNTFDRLSDKAYNIGLISKEMYVQIQNEQKIVKYAISELKKGKSTEIFKLFSSGNPEEIQKRILEITGNIPFRTQQTIYAEILYEPYIKREEKEVEKMKFYQQLEIPDNFNYSNIPGLSIELQQKLSKIKPKSIAHASLIQGMTPAALSLLIFKIKEFTNQIKKYTFTKIA